MINKFIDVFKKSISNKVFKMLVCNIAPVSTATLFAFTVCYWNTRNYGLALSCDGKEIATVKNEEMLDKANQIMRPSASCQSFEQVFRLPVTEYKLKVVDNTECKSIFEVKDKIIEQVDNNVFETNGIYSNGNLVAVINPDEDATKLLDDVLKEAKNGDDNAESKFVEDVEVVSGLYNKDDIKDIAQVKNIINNGIPKRSEYEVKEGDTIDIISSSFGVTPDSLVSLNNLDCEPKEKDKLIIETIEFPISIEIQKTESCEVEIPYQTVREEDENRYEGSEDVDIKGENGLKNVTSRVIYLNGQEKSREEISSETINDPVDEHVFFGTKKRVNSKNSSGDFVWPVPYTHRITSKYGALDGAFRSKPHTGIDISSNGVYGKDIVAVADGCVESAGNGGGYGNFVKISHGNGIKTMYAHCKSINVKPGQKVSAGQTIAAVGNTGNSTGPHLHFEVIENGSHKNPLNFVN